MPDSTDEHWSTIYLTPQSYHFLEYGGGGGQHRSKSLSSSRSSSSGEWPPSVKLVPREMFFCPFCDSYFNEITSHTDHIGSAHRLTQPLITFNGNRIESDYEVRSHLDINAIQLHNCTNIEVSKNSGAYSQWSERKLVSDITSETDASYRIKIKNNHQREKTIVNWTDFAGKLIKKYGSVHKNYDLDQEESDLTKEDQISTSIEYKIRVRIVNVKDLLEIDTLFVDNLAVDNLTASDIRRFADKCQINFPNTEDYFSALADYCFGTMIRGGMSDSPFQDFKEKYQKSIHVLTNYNNRLPVTISNCIKFVLNDFKSNYVDSGVDELDFAMRFFINIAIYKKILGLTPPPVLQSQIRPLCLSDKTFIEFLEILRYWRPGVGFPDDCLDKISEKVNSGRLSDQDREKFQVLFSSSHIEANQAHKAKPELIKLSNNSMFGPWAEKQLAELR